MTQTVTINQNIPIKICRLLKLHARGFSLDIPKDMYLKKETLFSKKKNTDLSLYFIEYFTDYKLDNKIIEKYITTDDYNTDDFDAVVKNKMHINYEPLVDIKEHDINWRKNYTNQYKVKTLEKFGYEIMNEKYIIKN